MSNKQFPRPERWALLRRKLRSQILKAMTSKRLQTLVNRLNVVNADNRKHDRAQGLPGDQMDLIVSNMVVKVKRRTII